MKKFRELKEEVSTPPIGVRSLYTKMYAKHGGTAAKSKDAQSKAYAEVEKKHGKEMRNSLEAYHKKNMNEENLDEGRPSQQHPLEGHEYHTKTNAELEYIAKDAHKAAEAMKGHNTQAENKYRDQANDSATVRYFRQKNGMPDWYKKKYGHMKEAVKDKFDIGEYDQEGDMAKSDLRSILANAKRVHDMLEDDDNLPEWVQSKITKAEDYISTVANYMEAEMNEETELDERIVTQGTGYSSDPLVARTGISRSLKRPGEDAEKAKSQLKMAIKSTVQNKEHGKSKLPEELDFEEAFGYSKYQQNYKKITGKTPEDRVREIEAMQKKMAQQKKDYEAELASRKMKEEVELEEENKPTNPELWARAKALAKQKFDVYPSAYANGWASKWYKSKGGSWRSVSEAKEEPPFEPSKKPIQKSIPGKYGKNYSTVRHIARQAMQRQMKQMKQSNEDKFQKNPELANTLTKNV